MTDLELRKKHNEAAVKAIGAVRSQMYPGMILSVEPSEDCITGRGIVATPDDVYNALPRELQYNPHVMGFVSKDGRTTDIGNKDIQNPHKQSVDSKVRDTVLRSLEDLL